VNGEAGVDIVIPFAVPVRGGDVDISDPDSYRLSAILIQIKNWKSVLMYRYLPNFLNHLAFPSL
jgi:hypothetical protein